MKIKATVALILLSVFITKAQDKTAIKYANKIDSLSIKTNLFKIASDEFEGRKSSEKGAELTANYLVKTLKNYKIKGANNGLHKQNIEAVNIRKSKKHFTLDDFNFEECYNFKNKAYQDSIITSDKIVFAGYGIYDGTYNDFANIDIKDKIVMILEGDGPVNKFGVKCHNSNSVPNNDYINSQKPKAILVVKNNFNTFRNYTSEGLIFNAENENPSVPKIEINELLANKILNPTNKSIKQILAETESTLKPNSFEFENKISFNGNCNYKKGDVNNIVSIIEGTDLKDEFIIISAHYDHIGKNYQNKTYYGADDNGSGVSAILEIAKTLNQAKKDGKGLRRSVVVLLTTAEEDGLCGSEYYVKKPLFPMEKTVACINIDMIGRNGSDIDKEAVNKGYVYALTGYNDVNKVFLSKIDSINNVTTKLQILTEDKAKYDNFFKRSDQYTFHKKNIPSIMFTNGKHDDLHRITDTPEKINYQLLTRRTKLAFLMIWELGNN